MEMVGECVYVNRRCLCQLRGEEQPERPTSFDLFADASEAVAALSRLLAVRLAQAGSAAPDPGDRAACADAARGAEDIYGLLHRSGP